MTSGAAIGVERRPAGGWAAVLQEVSDVDSALIGPLLLAYGVAGVAGNFVLGMQASRRLRRTLGAVCFTITVTLALIPLASGMPFAGIALLVVWGLAYGAVSVSLRTWMLTAAPRAADTATSLFVALFNLSIALGAVAGAFAVDIITTAAALWAGAGLVLAAGVAAATGGRTTPHNPEGN